MSDPYIRRARLDRIVDGDTIDLWVDQGFYSTLRLRFRLARVDTPEIFGSVDPEEKAAGAAAAEYVAGWMQAADAMADNQEWPLLVRSEKSGKYGRWIGEITTSSQKNNLSDDLLGSGHAKQSHS